MNAPRHIRSPYSFVWIALAAVLWLAHPLVHAGEGFSHGDQAGHHCQLCEVSHSANSSEAPQLVDAAPFLRLEFSPERASAPAAPIAIRVRARGPPSSAS